MQHPKTQILKKSQTHSFALPNISKTQTKILSNRTGNSKTSRHHSVFLDKIKDMTQDTRYQQMQTDNIKVQHKQLQSLLRQFNQQTYNMLSNYIDKPTIAKLSAKKERSTSTAAIMEIKKKQYANNNEILEICQREMDILQKKCQYLKYVTYDDFQNKIQSIKAEIQETRNYNKQILRENTLRGLNIKRSEDKANCELTEIDQQRLILQKRRQKLMEDTKCVDDEIEKLIENNSKADRQIENLYGEYMKYERIDRQSKDQEQLMRTYQDRQKQYNEKKEKMSIAKIQHKSQSKELTKNTNLSKKANNTEKQSQNQSPVKLPSSNKYQYKYLKVLKQLDQILQRIHMCTQNAADLEIRIQKSREEIKNYQDKLMSDKKVITLKEEDAK